ncbi:MAG: zinc-binding alcohol dehydrogenase family protein [bacterium]
MMKALLITEPGKTVFGGCEELGYGHNEVLVEVKMVGFCGTDLKTFRGENAMVTFPRVPGHEIAGIIREVGQAVPGKWTAGMPVTVSPYTSCGTCASCRRSRPNACEYNQTLGVQRDGAMTQFIRVPWQKLHGSANLSFHELALVEPLSVGFHSVTRGEVEPGETVVVFGCGAIGLAAIATANWRGARVIAVGRSDEKLDLARKIGASDTINSRTHDLHSTLQNMTEGGPDVIIEAVGAHETLVSAVEEASFAGRVVIIGYGQGTVPYDTNSIVKRELSIRGSRNAPDGAFSGAIAMLEQGHFPAGELVTRTVYFNEAGRALEAWSDNTAGTIRIHVTMEG